MNSNIIFQNLLEMMLKDILFHYVNMGASQFLRDFRLAYKVKKTAELRKKVQQRKEKQQEKADSVPFLVGLFPLLYSPTNV